MAISRAEAFEYSPKVTRLSEALSRDDELSNARVFYDEDSDILLLYIEYVELAISYEVDDDLYLLLDPETEEAVGFQFDNFLNTFVIDQPQLMVLADIAGVPDDTILAVRRKIGADRWKAAFLRRTLHELREYTLP